MHLERYEVLANRQHEVFTFWSKGKNGLLMKVIVYQRMSKHSYNLAFGDWDPVHKRLNDLVRSNNGDVGKVMATVAYSIIEFMRAHLRATLTIKGSTPARTRLYQMGIAAHYVEICNYFEITGICQGVSEPFIKGKNYDEFSIKNKNILNFKYE